MEKGVDTAREHELDEVGDEDEDDPDEEDEEDEEDDEDDEDDEPEPGPEPRPPSRRRPPAPTITSKDDLKTIILEKYQKGMEAWQIRDWLEDNDMADPETGEFLTIHQIGGFKGLLSPQKPNPTQPTEPAADASASTAGATAIAAAQQGKVVIPRPRTKLDTFVEMLEKAMATSNEAMAQIAVDGIYKEMERGDGGGMNTQIFELLKAQLEGGKGKNKITELKELTDIVKNLMPEPAQGESEAVQMAKVMSDTTLKVTEEAKDTILQVSGSKKEADKVGTCPNCKKLIPMDSLFCPYCGLAFKQQLEEEEEEEDPAEAAERKRQEEAARKRAELAKRAVKRTPPAKVPPPPQPTPQPAKPPAPAPAPAAQPAAAPATAPTPQPAGPAVTPEERGALLRNLKKLANFIAAKDDAVLKTQALFKAGDNDDRKNGLFLAIIGREKLLAAAHRLITEHPELAEFSNYVEVCDSVDGKAWIDASFEEVKKQARMGGIMLRREEAADMLSKVEARLGFAIE